MRLTFLVRPALFLLALSSPALQPATAQGQTVLFDPVLKMPAENVSCQAGFAYQGAVIRNPASLDP